MKSYHFVLCIFIKYCIKYCVFPLLLIQLQPPFMYSVTVWILITAAVIVPRAIQEWTRANWPYQSGEGPFISQRHTEHIKVRQEHPMYYFIN